MSKRENCSDVVYDVKRQHCEEMTVLKRELDDRESGLIDVKPMRSWFDTFENFNKLKKYQKEAEELFCKDNKGCRKDSNGILRCGWCLREILICIDVKCQERGQL
jgi:hypothetical protein